MSSGRDRRGEAATGCEWARVLLMGYLDGELDAAGRRRLEDHLAVCVACRRAERAYRRLGEVTEMAGDEGGFQIDPDDAWAGIYARIERGLGWVLVSVGLILLGGYGLWQLLQEFLLSSEVSLAARIGVGTLVGGCLVLLVSFLREKLWRDSTERYREVRR